MAIVHDWIATRTGAERVYEELAAMFPHADLWALTHDPDISIETGGRSISTTLLNRPWLRQRRALTLPLMPLAWNAVRDVEYDLVISAPSAFAHFFRPGRRARHLAYVHSPARYVWLPEVDGRGASPALVPARMVLQRLDVHHTRYVDSFAANSRVTQDRIRRFWGFESTVIHPPVTLERFIGIEPARPSVVGFVGRWIPYKRVDLVIRVAKALDMPALIVGGGPLERDLKDLARSIGAKAEFIVSPTDEEVCEAYARMGVMVFPGIEDFGIVPVEAQAAGIPVVGPNEGGLTETVAHGITGLLCKDVSVGALAAGVLGALEMDSEDCKAQASHFSQAAFRERIARWVNL